MDLLEGTRLTCLADFADVLGAVDRGGVVSSNARVCKTSDMEALAARCEALLTTCFPLGKASGIDHVHNALRAQICGQHTCNKDAAAAAARGASALVPTRTAWDSFVYVSKLVVAILCMFFVAAVLSNRMEKSTSSELRGRNSFFAFNFLPKRKVKKLE